MMHSRTTSLPSSSSFRQPFDENAVVAPGTNGKARAGGNNADASIVTKPTIAASTYTTTTTTPGAGMKKKSGAATSQRRAFGDISNRKQGGGNGGALLEPIHGGKTNTGLPKTPFAASSKSTTKQQQPVKILNDNKSKNILPSNNNNGKDEPTQQKQQQKRVGFILPDDDDGIMKENDNVKPAARPNKSGILKNDDKNDILPPIELPAGRTWLEQQEFDGGDSDDDDVLSVEDLLIDMDAILAQRQELQDEMEEEAVAKSWKNMERSIEQMHLDDERAVASMTMSSSSMNVFYDGVDDDDLNLDLSSNDEDDDNVVVFDIPF